MATLKIYAQRILATTLMISFLSQNGWAQQTSSTTSGPRRQLASIIYAGLGGAVLGLSTLSFYGRPQEKLSNIAVGFAFGIIVGTVYVTYQAATNPNDFYASSSHSGRVITLLESQRQAQLAKPQVLNSNWKF